MIVFKRATYIPVDEDVPGAELGVVIVPRAPNILPKAIAPSSLLADVVVGKFVGALPLYRREKIFAREGIDVPRQTMADWMTGLEERLKAWLDEQFTKTLPDGLLGRAIGYTLGLWPPLTSFL